MTQSLLLPLNNAYAKGDFTAQISLEGQDTPVNLILDTGSSSLVVKAESVKHGTFQPTQIAQHLAYGAGDWIGPVVTAQVRLGKDSELAACISLPHIKIALAQQTGTDTFMQADGILGLAYAELNIAHDVSQLLVENKVQPAITYPWPKQFLQQSEQQLLGAIQKGKKQLIPPLFEELVAKEIVADQFAFVVHRSSVYTSKSLTKSELYKHPLNTGILIIGNPKTHKHMHEGDFATVEVVHDKYYNVNICSVGIKGMPKIPFPSLQEHDKKAYISNGIVDTGASAIVIPMQVFTALENQFEKYHRGYGSIIEQFSTFTGNEKGIPLKNICLKDWPDIEFEISSSGGSKTTLSLSPETYWQTHAPEANLISFKITTLAGWPNQGILGLPLLNNYFTIFNRSEGENGEIAFANKKFAPHKLDDADHQDHIALDSHFDLHGHKL